MDLTREQIRQEAAECDARKVEQAKRMSGQEKLRAGAELFEMACKTTMAGIRARHPEFTEEECLEELRRIVALG